MIAESDGRPHFTTSPAAPGLLGVCAGKLLELEATDPPRASAIDKQEKKSRQLRERCQFAMNGRRRQIRSIYEAGPPSVASAVPEPASHPASAGSGLLAAAPEQNPAEDEQLFNSQMVLAAEEAEKRYQQRVLFAAPDAAPSPRPSPAVRGTRPPDTMPESPRGLGAPGILATSPNSDQVEAPSAKRSLVAAAEHGSGGAHPSGSGASASRPAVQYLMSDGEDLDGKLESLFARVEEQKALLRKKEGELQILHKRNEKLASEKFQAVKQLKAFESAALRSQDIQPTTALLPASHAAPGFAPSTEIENLKRENAHLKRDLQEQQGYLESLRRISGLQKDLPTSGHALDAGVKATSCADRPGTTSTLAGGGVQEDDSICMTRPPHLQKKPCLSTGSLPSLNLQLSLLASCCRAARYQRACHGLELHRGIVSANDPCAFWCDLLEKVEEGRLSAHYSFPDLPTAPPSASVADTICPGGLSSRLAISMENCQEMCRRHLLPEFARCTAVFEQIAARSTNSDCSAELESATKGARPCFRTLTNVYKTFPVLSLFCDTISSGPGDSNPDSRPATDDAALSLTRFLASLHRICSRGRWMQSMPSSILLLLGDTCHLLSVMHLQDFAAILTVPSQSVEEVVRLSWPQPPAAVPPPAERLRDADGDFLPTVQDTLVSLFTMQFPPLYELRIKTNVAAAVCRRMQCYEWSLQARKNFIYVEEEGELRSSLLAAIVALRQACDLVESFELANADTVCSNRLSANSHCNGLFLQCTTCIETVLKTCVVAMHIGSRLHLLQSIESINSTASWVLVLDPVRLHLASAAARIESWTLQRTAPASANANWYVHCRRSRLRPLLHQLLSLYSTG